MASSDGIYSNSPPNTEHRFSVIVTSFQDDDFYPMDIISYNEMVSFEGTVIRSGMKSQVSGDKTAVAKQVDLLDIKLGHHLPSRS
jgi:hypothetical protein